MARKSSRTSARKNGSNQNARRHPSKPVTSKTNTSKPNASKPDTTKPNASKPDTTKPDVSDPDTSPSAAPGSAAATQPTRPERSATPEPAPSPAPSQSATGSTSDSSATSRRSSLVDALGVLGLATLATGLFALPVQAHGLPERPDVGFVQIRQLAGYATGTGDFRGDTAWAGGFARAWWTFGLFLGGGLLTLLVAALVSRALVTTLLSARVTGVVLAAVAVAVAVLHIVALLQTGDYDTFVSDARTDGSLFTDAGAGTWTAFGGLFVLAVAGLLVALGDRRRTPSRAR